MTASQGDAAPIPVVAGDELDRLLPIEVAIDALERDLSASLSDPAGMAPRIPISRGDQELLIMPAWGPVGAGVKLATIAPGNSRRGLPRVHGIYVLFSSETMAPRLVLDGGALTRIRTAAVSALATRLLARTASTRLVVFGPGVQGEVHVDAMRAVRPIESVTIVGPPSRSESATALVARLTARGIDARVGTPTAVREADIVCTCTTSLEPVFSGSDLPRGVHVNAVGAYRPDMCELDADTLARSLLVVETEESALAEAGDLIQAIDAGRLPVAGFGHELSSVIAGMVSRTDDETVTVFKSVGLGVADLILACAVADRVG